MLHNWWTCFLIPGLMVILGLIFTWFPPKKMNGLVGYRTTRSMGTQEAWDFANQLLAKLLWQTGLAFGVLAFLLMRSLRLLPGGTQSWIAFAFEMVEVAGLILLMVPIERALKENFDDCGVRCKKD